MDSELGEAAALSEKERIKKLLQGQDLVILIGCLGGGTASGAAPIFAKISRSLGNLTYGIFTLPFKFEGDRKMEIAKNALEKIKTKVNALSIIPNERIFQVVSKATPLKQALSVINKNLAESLEGLIEIIYEPGLINIDFADLRAVLEGQGRLAYLNTIEVQRKEGSAEVAIEKVLNSPLYPYKIKGAKAVLFDIGGESGLSLEEVSKISKTISDEANKDAKIIFGISQGKKYSGRIRTTLLATGCGAKVFLSGKKRKASKKKEVSKIEEKKPIKKRRKVKKNSKIQKNRKVKIEINKKPKEEIKAESAELKKETVLASFAINKTDILGDKIRKNALQIKKEVQEEEAKMIEEEKAWETPAFLRQNKTL
jgi:cell division protein FtsZ